MASNRGTKGGCMKSPKKEDDDDDFLEDLVVDTNPEKPKKKMTYSNLKPGGFITKAEDRKGRLDKRHARIAAAREQDDDDVDDDNDDNDETKKEQLERETRQLQSELRKTERAVERARDQEEKEKAEWFSKHIQSGVFLKQPQAV